MSRIHKNCPSHTSAAFNPNTLTRIVTWASNHIKKLNVDAVASCGHSGLSVAAPIAYKLKIPLIGVRRSTDRPVAGTEYSINFNFAKLPNSYVIIDDCISSGGTATNIIDQMIEHEVMGEEKKSNLPVAILLYNEDGGEYSRKTWPIEGSWDGEKFRKILRKFKLNADLDIKIISKNF